MISPYSKDIAAKHPKVITPVICSASIVASLGVGATTIAESAVSFLFGLLDGTIYTTIFGDVDLCIMQCCCLIDLLFNQCKCIHCSTPKVVGFLGPFL